ncbi:MAG: hypothetical protein M3N22_08870 [Acidobacteriota bacterium]|nr:hypothetical protein [Acidobacteriota bacterium]
MLQTNVGHFAAVDGGSTFRSEADDDLLHTLCIDWIFRENRFQRLERRLNWSTNGPPLDIYA